VAPLLLGCVLAVTQLDLGLGLLHLSLICGSGWRSSALLGCVVLWDARRQETTSEQEALSLDITCFAPTQLHRPKQVMGLSPIWAQWWSPYFSKEQGGLDICWSIIHWHNFDLGKDSSIELSFPCLCSSLCFKRDTGIKWDIPKVGVAETSYNLIC
jgi:hypothetical protein